MHDDRDLAKVLSPVLEAEPAVVVAHVFGSRARGDAAEGSDVDVAVLGARPFGPLGLGRMAERLGRAAGGATVDVVDLSVAPPLVADEAVRDGIALMVRDEGARFDFEQAALRRVIDTRRLRRDQQELLRERAAAADGRPRRGPERTHRGAARSGCTAAGKRSRTGCRRTLRRERRQMTWRPTATCYPDTTVSDLLARITTNPAQCGGRPCVRGMRIRVTDVLDLLASGLDIEHVLEELPDLERDDVVACLRFASRRIDHPILAA